MRILASLTATDPAAYGEAADRLIASGVDGLHIDIADGSFVPYLTVGPGLVAALRRRLSDVLLDVHLMTGRPEAFFEELAAAGADRVAFHAEATRYPWRLVTLARRAGIGEIGLALNPASPLALLDSCSHDLSFVNQLTTEPDVDGERLLPNGPARIADLRAYLGGRAPILVDGGVSVGNIRDLVRAGASDVVVGRAITGAADQVDAVERLRAAAR